jgi:TorA maturation chaperone TorD
LLNDIDPAVFRSRVYRTLAAAFSPPKADTGTLYDALLKAHATFQPTRTPLEANAPEDQNLQALAREHLRLFVGPGHIPCPPYEAVYRKDRPNFERGLVMGPSTAAVRRMYLAAGLDISKSYTDLPDHIAAEMEFMQFLCAEERRFTQQGNNEEAAKMKKMQKEFHKNHIEPWIEDFADCILRSTTSSFYKTTASLLKEFMKSEANYLADVA